MTTQLYRHGRIFTSKRAVGVDGGEPASVFAECMLVKDGKVAVIGGEADVHGLAEESQVIDLHGKLVVPGFIDGHAHVTSMGSTLSDVELIRCETVADIQEALRTSKERYKDAARIVCKNWKQTSTGPTVTAADLDAVVRDKPVYVVASTLHASWLNTAALAEIGITDDTPDPDGGEIFRDKKTGKANGIMNEMAHFALVWPGLAALKTDEEQDADLRKALNEYSANGYTGTIEMALDRAMLNSFQRVKKSMGGRLPVRVSAYWFVLPAAEIESSLDEVRTAAKLKEEGTDDWLRIVGVKVMVDGIVDVCTAALKKPYAEGGMGEPVWPLDKLQKVVSLADSLGLQVAMHAIGDQASHIAIEAVASLGGDPTKADRRHRIEHLELTDPTDVARLAPLGITASVQPIHADPAHLDGYMAKLGNDERCGRMFALRDMANHGAHMAFGTDTPTAPHSALSNLYSAVLRRSVHDPDLPNAFHPEWALPLASSFVAATQGAAYSVKAERWCGSLEVGKSADFAVLDFDPFHTSKEQGHGLLTGKVIATYCAGQKTFEAS